MRATWRALVRMAHPTKAHLMPHLPLTTYLLSIMRGFRAWPVVCVAGFSFQCG
jgi:hypothetical protein